MKRLFWLVVLELASGLALSAQGLLIPFYVAPPSSYFTQVIALKQLHPSVPLYTVLNVATGPGTGPLSAYTTAIGQLQAVGVVVLGYVDTSDATYTLAAVEAEVAQWQSYYPTVNGIMFDNMSNATTYVSYYASLTSYVHTSGMTVSIGNAGTTTPAAFFSTYTMDWIVISESSGWPTTTIMQNGGVGAASQKAMLVYNGAFSSTNLATATASNSLVWATDGTLPNPWDTLPSYVATLFAAMDTTTPPAGIIAGAVTVAGAARLH